MHNSFRTIIATATLFILNSAYINGANLTKEEIENLTNGYKERWYNRAVEVYNKNHPNNEWTHQYFTYKFPDDADFEAGNPPDKPMTSYEWMENAGVGFTKKLSIPSGPYSYSKELVKEWKKYGLRAGRFHIAPTAFLDKSDPTGYKLDKNKLKVLKDACQLFIDENIPVVISTGSYGYGYTNFNEDWEGSFNHIIDWWRQIAEYFKDTSYLLAFENFIEYHGFDRVPIERHFRVKVDNNESRYPKANYRRKNIDNYVREPAYNNLNAEIAKVFRVTNPKRIFIYKPRGVGRNNIGAITPWRWGSEIDPKLNPREAEFYWLISSGGGANTRVAYIQALRETNETKKKRLINYARYKSWGEIVDYHNITQLPVWISLMGIKTDKSVVNKKLDGVAPTDEEIISYLNWYMDSIQTLTFNPKTMKRDRIPNGFQQSWWLWHFGIEKPTWKTKTIYNWDVAKIRDTLGSHSFGGGLKPKYYPPKFLRSIIKRDGASVNHEFNSTIFYDAISDKEDNITFVKVSGPEWLRVLPDGTLKGVPTIEDIGVNKFEVGVVNYKGDIIKNSLEIEVSRYKNIEFIATDDSECQKYSKNRNLGDRKIIYLRRLNNKYAKLGFFKFKVDTNEEIKKATLRLFILGSKNNLNVYLVNSNDWNEKSITWSNRPLNVTKIATPFIEKRGYVDIDITPIVTQSGIYSFELETPHSDFKIYTKESNFPPKLIISTE